jgi:hypothetical protein
MAKKSVKSPSKVKAPAKGKELPGEALEKVVGGARSSEPDPNIDPKTGLPYGR